MSRPRSKHDSAPASGLDLNLLVSLDVLLREGSVAKAAVVMGLSAPAMSRTLGRIRTALVDPVLVRAGRGLVPTPRALEMREAVRALVESAGQLLGPRVATTPAQFRRTFRLRADDAAVAILGTALLQRVVQQAPGVTLRFVEEGDEEVAALREGTVEIDLGVQGPLGPEVRMQALYTDTFVLVVRRQSPLARGPFTLSRYLEAEHIGVSREGRHRGPVDDWLTRRGKERQVRMVVPTHLSASMLAAHTDAVAMVPRSVARALEKTLALKTVVLPIPLPPFTIAQAWHPRFDSDPVHMWMRKQLRELTSELRAGNARLPG